MVNLTVSIITPSFNQGQFIEETIKSVLCQRIPNLEYVVMDGGSTDATVAILERYQNQLRFVSERDAGQADAVNKGILATQGEIIGWLNSDDIYYPDAINKVCAMFAKHPEIDLIYGDSYQIDKASQVIERYPTEPWRVKRLLVHCFISQPAVFFRRRAVEKYGLLDTKLFMCMDYEYWVRLALAGACIYHLPKVLAGTRIYDDTKSSRYIVQAHLEAIDILRSKLGYVPSEWLVNYSSAKVKTEKGQQFPHPQFVLGVWLSLWQAAGLHHQGRHRVTVWAKAQLTMLKKLLIRMVRRRA